MKSISKVVRAFDESEVGHDVSVNSGGCGCFAMELLSLYPGLKPVYLSNWRTNQKEKYERDEYYAPSHVVVTDGVAFYDSEGRHTKTELKRDFEFMHVMDKEFLKESLDCDDWNDTFDRDDIERIRDELYYIVNN